MKKCILTILFAALCSFTFAQKVTHMYPNKESRIFFDSVKYVNPQFINGVVIFNDGKQAAGKMNISTINQGIHFVDSKNDTLAINTNDAVDRAYINGKLYVKSKFGFIEILEMTENGGVGELKSIIVHSDAQTGAYGLQTQTSTVQTVTSFDETDVNLYLKTKQDKPFAYIKEPYLMIKGSIYPFTKKNLAKIFPQKKAQIESYMKEHNPNLNAVAPAVEMFKAIEAL